MGAQKTRVVVGQGMVGYKLLECLVDNGAADRFRIVAFGEEPRAAYDRVGLSTYFTGRTAEDLCRADPEVLDHPSIEFLPGAVVTGIDREARKVTAGRVGSWPTTRRCWPPAPTRSCRLYPAGTARAASSTAPSRTSTRSGPTPLTAGRGRSSAAGS